MQLPEINILYEDKYLLALNKPHGIVVEFEPFLKFTLESQAMNYLRSKEKYPDKCFIGLPQRLDRPVSGVVLLAKKKSTLKELVDIFSKRKLSKYYYAIVENSPANAEAELVDWLVKDTEKRKAIIYPSQVADSKKVILRYKIMAQNKYGALLKVKLITGKFHQIRAQLANIGCPIVGDSHYGSTKPYKENAICLHAFRLQLVHPTTKEPLNIAAPIPHDEIWESFVGVIS